MCIALATYSCRDSRGIGRLPAFTAFPQGPFPGTGAIMEPDRGRTLSAPIRESGAVA
jgi:hypothetical protein